MYEHFNDEERAMFRDAERYATIASLWKEFSLYLIARKTNYHYYRVLRLTEGITICSRRGRRIGSGPTFRVYGGLVLLKKVNWYRRKRRVLIIDHSKNVSSSRSEKPEDFMNENPVIIGMDLDLWETVESALLKVRAMRLLCEHRGAAKKEAFKRRITGRSEVLNDSRYDLLDLERDDRH